MSESFEMGEKWNGKTCGEKPKKFAFEENGDQFMIASEVAIYLRLFRGALFVKYPGLVKRILTNDERKKLKEMGHISPYSFSTITLVLANQVEDIITGQDDHLRRKRK